MNRIRMIAAAVILCGLGTGLTVLGQEKDKKGPNIQEPVKGVKETEKTKALQDLELASRLIRYGRANKHAESLLIAAQIIHTTPTQALKAAATTTGEKKEDAAPAAKMDNSPKALVAEAKKLSSSPAVQSLAAATMKIIDEETRGRLGGPGNDVFTLRPNNVRTWTITFVGGQLAVVDIDLYGATAYMTLEVRDQFGNVVARDNVPGPFYNVRWTPAFTSTFTVRLVNNDFLAFNCVLRTN